MIQYVTFYNAENLFIHGSVAEKLKNPLTYCFLKLLDVYVVRASAASVVLVFFSLLASIKYFHVRTALQAEYIEGKSVYFGFV